MRFIIYNPPSIVSRSKKSCHVHSDLNMFTKPCLYLKSNYILLQTLLPPEVTQQITRVRQFPTYFLQEDKCDIIIDSLDGLFSKEFLLKRTQI